MLKNNKFSWTNQVSNSSVHDELSSNVLCFPYQGKKTTWILDNGVTDHIIYNSELFTTSKIIRNKIVGLPDRSIANVKYVGQVVFSSSLVLDDVLCVLNFQLNLISITQLACYSFCTVTFLTYFCTRQDLRSEKMIGLGTEHRELYYLDEAQTSSCNSAIPSSSIIWHQRLEHSSNKVSVLFSSLDNKFCCTHNCSVCLLAKQTRLPFLLSKLSSQIPFEKLHIDIWNGYCVSSDPGV